jgi:hypothetical protein
LEDVPPYRVEGYQITRCPMIWLTYEFELLDIFRDHEKGILPNAGGGLDQPMKFSQIIAIIGNVSQELENKENAK